MNQQQQNRQTSSCSSKNININSIQYHQENVCRAKTFQPYLAWN